MGNGYAMESGAVPYSAGRSTCTAPVLTSCIAGTATIPRRQCPPTHPLLDLRFPLLLYSKNPLQPIAASGCKHRRSLITLGPWSAHTRWIVED